MSLSTATHRPTTGALAKEIAHLRSLELRGLRARWQTLTGREAPLHLAQYLLFAIIAYRIQADALGDLENKTIQLLNKIGAAQSGTETVSITDAFDQRQRKPLSGTILTREWNGQNYRAIVVENGFAWEGRTYNSLSKIAYAITGTKWNGPRFFGLRDKAPSEVEQ